MSTLQTMKQINRRMVEQLFKGAIETMESSDLHLREIRSRWEGDRFIMTAILSDGEEYGVARTLEDGDK